MVEWAWKGGRERRIMHAQERGSLLTNLVGDFTARRPFVDGVDGAFIGPSDLSADLGHLGNPHAAAVVTAIDGALDAIAASGKASGIFAVDPVDAERYLAKGVSFVAVASDINSMTIALRQTASRFRQ